MNEGSHDMSLDCTGTVLAVAGVRRRKVAVLNAYTGHVILFPQGPDNADVDAIAFSPTESVLAVGWGKELLLYRGPHYRAPYMREVIRFTIQKTNRR